MSTFMPRGCSVWHLRIRWSSALHHSVMLIMQMESGKINDLGNLVVFSSRVRGS